MGQVEVLKGSVVALDTAPLIYFIERNSQFIDRIRPYFRAVENGEFTIVTSEITLLEVLVIPLRMHNEQLVKTYREHLYQTKGLTTIGISSEILTAAAQIRATHPKVRTPDAIQLATAIEAKASFFLTNDANLPEFPDIQMLVLNQLNS